MTLWNVFEKVLLALIVLMLAFGSFCLGAMVTQPGYQWGVTSSVYGIENTNVTAFNDELREVAVHSVTEHEYSLDDGYVCMDTAVDVWNLLKKRGIQSYLVIGMHENKDCASFECADHAWVVVPAPDGTEVAIETTRGTLQVDDWYFGGMRFNNPTEMETAWAQYYEVHEVY